MHRSASACPTHLQMHKKELAELMAQVAHQDPEVRDRDTPSALATHKWP